MLTWEWESPVQREIKKNPGHSYIVWWVSEADTNIAALGRRCHTCWLENENAQSKGKFKKDISGHSNIVCWGSEADTNIAALGRHCHASCHGNEKAQSKEEFKTKTAIASLFVGGARQTQILQYWGDIVTLHANIACGLARTRHPDFNCCRTHGGCVRKLLEEGP